MDFPSIEKQFYFDYRSVFGNRYEGQFTVKCLLTIGEKHALELEKSRLLGNSVNPTDELMGIAVILSTLRAKLTDAPNWWIQSKGGADIKEEDVIAELYAKVQTAESEWRTELAKKAQNPQPAQ